jgi:hypothetical protein
VARAAWPGKLLEERTDPRRECLSCAGGCVDEPTLAIEVRGPDLALERERSPTAFGEPCVDAFVILKSASDEESSIPDQKSASNK